MSKGMGGHQSARMLDDEWITPRGIIDALGPFDLDPCAAKQMPWKTATTMLTKLEDGLSKDWHGRVWLNPPYGKKTGLWLSRIARHGNGVALIFARTETADWFHHIWRQASGIFFLRGRLHFYFPNGQKSPHNSGAPSALIAYGSANVKVLEQCKLEGSLVTQWRGSYNAETP